MLLTGTYTRSLDAKLRIAVPKTLRDALSPQDEGVLFVAPGLTLDHISVGVAFMYVQVSLIPIMLPTSLHG